MTAPLLDANVVIRHLAQDHIEHSLRASNYLARIATAELQAELSSGVVFEVLFTMERTYKETRKHASEAVRGLIELAGMNVPDRTLLLSALKLHEDYRISMIDAHLATIALEGGVPVVSFDRGFDRIPGVQRIEP